VRRASLYDDRDTTGAVAERAISVRLDGDAERALGFLTRAGASQSEAVRVALIGAAREALREQARADAERVAADPTDRAEVAEIQALMDELSAPW
jgi:Arc/MetJ-type ribon-helix-helix transcriptional regulator